MGAEDLFALAVRLPEPMLLASTEGHVAAANPAFGELLGRPVRALVGRPLSELATDPPDKIKGYLAACARSGQMVFGSLTLRAGKQGAAPFRVEGVAAQPAGNGAGAGLVLLRLKTRQSATTRFLLLNQKIDELAREIAERKRAQEALRQSERFARSTVDALSAHLAILDEEGTILAVNRAWMEFAAANGAVAERVGAGVSYLAVCDRASGDEKQSAARFAAGLRAVIRGDREAFAVEYPCPSPALQRWYVARVSRFPGSGPLRVVVSHEDVSDRKRAETLLQSQKQVLEGIVEGVPLAETLTAVARLMEQQSSSGVLASILLLDREGLRLRNGASPSLPAGYVEAIEGLAIGPAVGSCGTAAFSRETVVVTDIGVDPLWDDYREVALAHGLAACWSSPVFGSEGHVLGTFALYYRAPRGPAPEDLDLVAILNRTVSIAIERKQVEEERTMLLASEQAAREEAEEANRAKDEFLATISHELRTPLNAILGWSEVLRSGQLDERQAARAVETIERNARTQAQLIGDILDYSRIISGQLRIEVGPVALVPLIEAALDVVRPAAEAKGVELRARFDTAAGQVSGDGDRLQQVVWNLLSNAVKFTPRGGRVDIALERVGSQVAIAVADTGEGINSEFLPHVFDRFRQADSRITREHGGLGLGLSIVRHLVELHGGTAEAASDGPGQGARFTVRLPVRVLQPARQRGPGNRSRVASGRGELPPAVTTRLDGLRVLVVEDDTDGRELLEVVLERSGAEVAAVPSAAAGLAEVSRLRPHVLVSDIEMPGEDGYQLIRKVRALGAERGGDVPAIALTAHARAEDRRRARAAGYHQHIAKPVDPEKLLATIARLARGRVADRQAEPAG